MKVDFNESRCSSKSIAMKVDAYITRVHRVESIFSESVRNMMQNGGVIVAIGSMFALLRNF